MRVAMVVYSHYSRDARVRRYAEFLSRKDVACDIISLKEHYKPKESTIRLIHFPFERRRINLLWYLLEYLAFFLYSFVILSIEHIKHPYRYIHIHNMPDFLVFAAFVPKLCGAKVILDMHDPMPELLMSKYGLGLHHPFVSILRFFEKISMRFADLVITANDTFRTLFLNRGSVSGRKIKTILNCPDPRIFRKNQPTKRADKNVFEMMYMGTVEPRFCLELAIGSMKDLVKKIPGIRLTIIPKLDYEGPYLQYLKTLVKDIGISKSVFFIAPKPLEDIARLIQRADVGIVLAKKSIFTQRIFPVKLLEFIQMGIPVIATKTNTLKHYFTSSDVKFLDTDNQSEFTKAVVQIYKNLNLRKSLTINAARYLSKYNWNEEEKKYQMLTDKLTTD